MNSDRNRRASGSTLAPMMVTMITLIITAIIGMSVVDSVMGSLQQFEAARAFEESQRNISGPGPAFIDLFPVIVIFLIGSVMLVSLVSLFSNGVETDSESGSPDPVEVAKERYIEGETTLAEFEHEVYDAIEIDIPVVEIEQVGPIPSEDSEWQPDTSVKAR